MPARRLRLLQIFNRYLNYGGEEGSVYRIRDTLREIHDVETFFSSTAELVGEGPLEKALLPWRALHNSRVLTQLERYRATGPFDAWQVHNVFPVMSPVVYEKALDWQIPMVHYLHNYRLSCVNGFFLNHGLPCQRCISGHFWPAFETACWRDSHLQSGWMGYITGRIRRLPLFEKVFQWIALSEAHRREHIRIGIPAECIRAIHHFLEPGEPVLPPSRSSTALFVGRLSTEKGVARLLEAWKMIAGGDRKLVIIGDGPERPALERQATGLRGVTFAGFVEKEQQRALWSEALFSIVPSIWIEPFGMTVLESFARGRPVVAHNIGALPEIITHGIEGLLADPENPRDLASQLDSLFSNPGKAETMGLAGRARLESQFNRARWLRDIAAVYDLLPAVV